jgi:hypothetical protein
MRTIAGKRSLAVALAVGLVLWSLLPGGCHWQRRTAGVSRPCPVCKRETRTLPVTSLTYTTCVCPVCRNVTTLNAATKAAVEAYTGAGIGDTVEVCSHCQIIVEPCAACRQKQGKPTGP